MTSNLDPLSRVTACQRALISRGYSDLGIGVGWSCLILDLVDALSGIDPRTRLTNIRQKYGELRVTLEPADGPAVRSPTALEAVQRAQARSLITCERCGRTPATIDWSREWVETLCRWHHADDESQRG
jgi:hypothetical protein